MARLPQPGGDSGNWGTILNDYLSQAHKADGTLKDDSVTAAMIAPGAVTKADVGLGQVDNTSDASKPISSAQQTALNAKLNSADLDSQTATNITTNGTDTQIAVEDAVQQAVQDHTPGIELGYAELVSTWTTTNTAAGSGAPDALITGIAVTVIGQGRPVDMTFYVANCYHSTPNTPITIYSLVNGAGFTSDNQVAGALSSINTAGPAVTMQRRLVLTDGVSYTFTVGVSGGVAGTTTLVAAGFAPISLSVTSR